jgi:ABC-type multidrug transport system fused ATPase/permease subunit
MKNVNDSGLFAVKMLFSYIWQDKSLVLRFLFLSSVFLSFLTSAATLALPYIFKVIIDKLTLNITEIVFGLVILYGIIQFLSKALDDFRLTIYGFLEQIAQKKMSYDVFQHVLRIPYVKRVDQDSASLSISIDQGIAGARTVLYHLFFYISPVFFGFFISFTIIHFNLGLKFSASFLIFTVVYGTITWYFSFSIKRIQDEYLNIAYEAYSRMADSLGNFEVIKLNRGENYVAFKYNEIQERFIRKVRLAYSKILGLGLVQAFVIAFCVLIITGLSIDAINRKEATIGSLILVNGYLLQIISPLKYLSDGYRGILQGLSSLNALEKILNQEVEELPKDEILPHFASLHVENICVSLQEKKILDKVSIEINSGEVIAIVGESGSGKTTLARVLSGLVAPNEGCLKWKTLDNVSHNTSFDTLRSRVAVVTQDTSLLNDSIASNIQIARSNASSDELVNACKAASIHEHIISLEFGYETIVGERGIKLSGGQRQRIGIARALLKESDFLIFDEATSSLDSVTEADVMSNIFDISKEKTTVIITHKLSNVVNADRIYLISNGVILASGSHNDLLKNSIYREQWETQSHSINSNANSIKI